MFSWKKSTNEQPRTTSSSNRSGGVDNMDFSDLLKDPVDANGDGTYDDDMDPDLLVIFKLYDLQNESIVLSDSVVQYIETTTRVEHILHSSQTKTQTSSPAATNH